MKKNAISEFELERQDFKIKLKRGLNGGTVTSYEDGPAGHPPVQVMVPGPAPVIAAAAGEAEIKSPMIGTFYRSPSPESAPYIEVGMEVTHETVVCIIEA